MQDDVMFGFVNFNYVPRNFVEAESTLWEHFIGSSCMYFGN